MLFKILATLDLGTSGRLEFKIGDTPVVMTGGVLSLELDAAQVPQLGSGWSLNQPVATAELASAAPIVRNLDYFQTQADQKLPADLPTEVRAKLASMKPAGLALAIKFADNDWRCFLIRRRSEADIASGKDNKGFKVGYEFYEQNADCIQLDHSSGSAYDHVTHAEGEKLCECLRDLGVHKEDLSWFFELDRNGKQQTAINNRQDVEGLPIWRRDIVICFSQICHPGNRDPQGMTALRAL